MVFHNQFVAAIKVNHKVLRERGNVVAVPFGAEYSVFLKNLGTVRSLAKVTIDGQEATEGTWLIVPANSSVELERFIRNGNMEHGNRFRFIKRTSQIEEHRGIQADDGLVRVEYKFERLPDPEVHTHYYTHYHPSWWYNWPYYSPTRIDCFTNTSGTIHTTGTLHPTGNIGSLGSSGPSGGSYRSAQTHKGGASGQSQSVNNANLNDASVNSTFTQDGAETFREAQLGFDSDSCGAAGMDVAADPGITVPGSESRQRFYTGAWFPTEYRSHTIILKLVGMVGGREVIQAVTVKSKPKCITCGRVNKANSQFCSACGTALQAF